MAGRDIRSGVVEVEVDDDGGDGLEKLENSLSKLISNELGEREM
jgi:hypothetical protein